MPIITPDLSEVTSFDCPVGTWPAKIVSHALQDSSKGNPMIVLSVEAEAEGARYKLRDYLVISGSAAYKLENVFRACKFDDLADRARKGEKLQFNTDQLNGQEFRVVVETELYEGKPQSKISSYLPR